MVPTSSCGVIQVYQRSQIDLKRFLFTPSTHSNANTFSVAATVKISPVKQVCSNVSYFSC